ncbi:DUF411 domain-containing protein [Methylobacterium iners]|uniref:Metal-binding protein n=1 Tax=Methylobacterium iners TaxID=418707 RepID=A0ABQ4RWB3_9HYPH|nr:DUF411 domain-containing protein [Methylobacterium iners]GJD94492.1 hypothetical protein OCOJLMKI_1694 [Methylobacterium iners]
MTETLRLTRRGLIAGLSATALVLPAVATEALPEIAVSKDPSCACCDAWVLHLRQAGFPVTVMMAAVNPLKFRLGIPRDLFSCHTGQVGGYVIEGHVPAPEIKRLLDEKPTGLGLSVPGMPVGSPGMEVEGMEPDTYDVVLFGAESRRAFARYRGGQAI